MTHDVKDADRLAAVLRDHCNRVQPLSQKLNEAYWEAAMGKPERLREAAVLELQLRTLHAAISLDELRALASQVHPEPLVARQLEVLEAHVYENQLDPELLAGLVESEARLEEAFFGYRPSLDGQPISWNQIQSLLRSEADPERRRRAFEAAMGRGAAVERALRDLVRLRNRAAQALGAADFWQLRQGLDGLDLKFLDALLSRIATRTDAPWAELMRGLSLDQARRFGVNPGDLAPWHFEDPFFERGLPQSVNLDPLFADRDLVEVARNFGDRLALPISPILERSDLLERPNKAAEAFCLDVDRSGDVRVFANLRRTAGWVRVLLHEVGHAVYFGSISPSLPWLLRSEPHPLVSEAVADLFGRQVQTPDFLSDVLGIPARLVEPRRAALLLDRSRAELAFTRFTLLLVHFERELYRDPEQNLNQLWWQLRERYQGLKPPPGRDQPDWAAEFHLVAAPVSYHHYLLGRCLASQIWRKLADGGRVALDPRLGAFLRDQVAAPGASLRWEVLVERITGGPLSEEAYLQEILPAP